MGREMCELEATIIQETTGALLCDIEGKEVWIPRSQIREDSDVSHIGDEGSLVIPEWLAIEKELI